MPISDANLYLCNISNADLTGEGAQTPVKVGKGPKGGMLLRCFASATAHASVVVEECDTVGGTYTDVALGNLGTAGVTMDGTPGAGEYAYVELPIKWTKRYLRVTLGDTPTGTGDMQVALIKGDRGNNPVDGA